MRIKLRDLDPQWLKFETRSSFKIVNTIAEADGISHLCPVCFIKNNGPIGTHSMIHWFRGRVPDDLVPGPGRWSPVGNSFDDLSFVPSTPPQPCSILQEGHAHFFITNGEIIGA